MTILLFHRLKIKLIRFTFRIVFAIMPSIYKCQSTLHDLLIVFNKIFKKLKKFKNNK